MSLFRARPTPPERRHDPNAIPSNVEVGGYRNTTGQIVSTDTALRLAAVYGSVSLIAFRSVGTSLEASAGTSKTACGNGVAKQYSADFASPSLRASLLSRKSPFEQSIGKTPPIAGDSTVRFPPNLSLVPCSQSSAAAA